MEKMEISQRTRKVVIKMNRDLIQFNDAPTSFIEKCHSQRYWPYLLGIRQIPKYAVSHTTACWVHPNLLSILLIQHSGSSFLVNTSPWRGFHCIVIIISCETHTQLYYRMTKHVLKRVGGCSTHSAGTAKLMLSQYVMSHHFGVGVCVRTKCEDVRYYSVYQKLTVQLWREGPRSFSGALVREWAEDVTRGPVIFTAGSMN